MPRDPKDLRYTGDPQPEMSAPDPLENLFKALRDYIDSEVDRRVDLAVSLALANQTPQEEEKWVSAKEVSKATGYSIPTINDLADKGIIPIAGYFQSGKRKFRKFIISDVKAALKNNAN